MDYHITMEDGSEYLAHHGVKGMHWGVWNDETRRKYLGPIGRPDNPKAEKLRAKAEKNYQKMDKSNSATELHMRAMKVHSNEITKRYAKANTSTVKAQAQEAKARRLEGKAERFKGADDKKSQRLEKKAQRQKNKAEVQRQKAKGEIDKAHAVSNDMERELVAERQLKADAAKYKGRAEKLEAKASRLEERQDRQIDKALSNLQENAAIQVALTSKSKPKNAPDTDNLLNLQTSAEKAYDTIHKKSFVDKLLGNSEEANAKRSQEVSRLMNLAIDDVSNTEKGQKRIQEILDALED